MDREGIALADGQSLAEVVGHQLLEGQLPSRDRHPGPAPGALQRGHADLRGHGLLPVSCPVVQLPANCGEIVLLGALFGQPCEAQHGLRR